MLIFFLLAPSIFTYHNHSLKLENSERVQSSGSTLLNKHELCFIINQNPIADQNLI